MNKWKSRESVVSYLEDYVSDIKDQIDRGKTKQTLLKSYVFETFNPDTVLEVSNTPLEIKSLFQNKENMLTQIDEQFFSVNKGKETTGFVEEVNDRFSILYSIDKANKSDKYTRSLIKNSPILDSLWISGVMFDSFLEKIEEEHHPNRYIKMKFEFDGFFSKHQGTMAEGEDFSDKTDIFDEHRVSSISLVEEAAEIANKLKGIRGFLPAFNSIGLLRFPNMAGKGGHDFYQNGKVTNRSDSFNDHRYQIIQTINSYQEITEKIEKHTWFDFEKITSPEVGNSYSFHGSPITVNFNTPLKPHVFRNFINSTFAKGREPFRIQGDPIWVDEYRAHIYGIDLHLWQKVILDLSLDKFVIYIPRGTCGNTIHRLVTNIQRFLEPVITVNIGNFDYRELISSTVRGSGSIE